MGEEEGEGDEIEREVVAAKLGCWLSQRAARKGNCRFETGKRS